MGYLEDYQRLYLFDMGLSKLYLRENTYRFAKDVEGSVPRDMLAITFISA